MKKRTLFIISLVLIALFTITPPRISGDVLKDNQNLEKKVAQMLLIGFRGTQVNQDSYIYKVLKDMDIGGVVLFDYDVPSQSYPRNIISPEQTKKLISDLQAQAQTPLFVAVDAEGGRINRLKEKYGFIQIPSAQEIGKSHPQNAEFTYHMLSCELAYLGFNLNLAPVVDLNLNPKNPVIGSLERSFSKDPQTVIDFALAFINAHDKNGVISALKHFPGHGSSAHDSHLGIVDVTDTYQNCELNPYSELIKRGKAQMIMTAHIMNSKVDPDYPATLSPNFLNKILRKKLNFKGVIISDDMQMGAIQENYGFSEALIRAVNAGCNILTLSNNARIYDEEAIYKALDIIIHAVKSGKISMDKINNSYRKIIDLKTKYNLMTVSPTSS